MARDAKEQQRLRNLISVREYNDFTRGYVLHLPAIFVQKIDLTLHVLEVGLLAEASLLKNINSIDTNSVSSSSTTTH